MDYLGRYHWPANVVGLLRAKFQGEDFEMNIEHKLEPIEHWIVDGKAYRLATEADVGREVYRSDFSFEDAIINATMELEAVEPYFTTVEWKYAYVQDDLLLTPQRTPVPALGDGWFLLTAEDGEFQEGDKITAMTCGSFGWLDWDTRRSFTIRQWLLGGSVAARYFGPAKEPQPEPAAKPIDWTKPVRTKDGRAVRVLCTDGPGVQPVIGIIAGDDKVEYWCLSGSFFTDSTSRRDLENAPQRIQREYWVCVYPDGIDMLWDTREAALRVSRNANPFACIKITIDCEEGEGL